MKGPYPDILFHFTTLPGLKGILKEGFRPSYAREKIVGSTTEKNFAVPMVSFCDLRLSELPFHMKKYGRFGIGLTKCWAKRNGLNPVAYVNKDSEFTHSLIAGFIAYANQIKSIPDWSTMVPASFDYLQLLNIERYIKNYEGDLVRGSKIIHDYRFADEREWRHVVPLNTKGILPFLPTDFMPTKKEKDFHNYKIKLMTLKFDITDIKYLIVQSEQNVKPMQKYIQGLSLSNSANEQHLLSRILTATQIESDM